MVYCRGMSKDERATTLHRHGDNVTYLGRSATVTHGNEPSPWTSGQPSAIVSITFTRPVPGVSRQMDVQASALVKGA